MCDTESIVPHDVHVGNASMRTGTSGEHIITNRYHQVQATVEAVDLSSQPLALKAESKGKVG